MKYNELEASPRWTAWVSGVPVGTMQVLNNELLLVPVLWKSPRTQNYRLQALFLENGNVAKDRAFKLDEQVTGLVIAPHNIALLSISSSNLLQRRGGLLAFDVKGHEIWHYRGGFRQVGAPAILEDRAYLVADGSTLVQLDLTHPPGQNIEIDNELARTKLEGITASYAPPLVAGERLVIPCRGPYLQAVTLDGKPSWRFQVPPRGTASWFNETPLLLEEQLFAVLSSGYVYAVSAEDGKPIWHQEIDPKGKPLTAPMTDGERLYLGAQDGLYALDLGSGETVWHFPTERKITATPVVTGGVVYFSCWDHHLYALDTASGSCLWSYAAERRIEVPPVLIGNETASPAVLVADRAGKVIVLPRPLSAVEHEAAGNWSQAAAAYVALGRLPYAAELLEGHHHHQEAAELWLQVGNVERAAAQYEAAGMGEQAAELWLRAGELERAATQYEAAEMWHPAAGLWERLKEVPRQAAALQHYARSLEEKVASPEEVADLWRRIANLYTSVGEEALAATCQREVLRCLKQPDIALSIEHDDLVREKWTMVSFTAENQGFGPARSLVVRAGGDQFSGQIMRTQTFPTLDPGEQNTKFLNLQPRAYGNSVPLEVAVDFFDAAGNPLSCSKTLHLPVAKSEPSHTTRSYSGVFHTTRRFVDLELRIYTLEKGKGYPVEITLGELKGRREFKRGYLSPDVLSIEHNEQELFNMLFADPVLRNAWFQAKGLAPYRRIQLRVDAGELRLLPWESLCEEGVTISKDENTPFSRYLPNNRLGDSVRQWPLRMLAVIANPRNLQHYGLDPIDVQKEQQNLEQTFSTSQLADKVSLEFLKSPVTLARLTEKLQDGYHFLHFVGHGGLDRLQQPELYMENQLQEVDRVPAHRIREILAGQANCPRMVVLAACHSATSEASAPGTDAAFMGLAPQLVDAGVPAVVAMQGKVSFATARKFSQMFYCSLAKHGTVDLAMNQARNILAAGNCLDATAPVLFMRLKDGQLFK